MEDQLNLTQEQRAEILRAVFEENQADRMFWRERAWKTVSAAVTALIGLGSASVFRAATVPFIILIVGVWAAATAYLLVAYSRYSDTRVVRLNVQEALGFFEEGVYLKGRALIPIKHRRSRPRLGGLLVFILLVFLVAACAIAAVLIGTPGTRTTESTKTTVVEWRRTPPIERTAEPPLIGVARNCMPELKIELPDWTEAAGGRDRWLAWVEGQVKRCCTRAAEWVRDHGGKPALRPAASEWRQAIVAALGRSEGRAAFSRFPLSMVHPRQNTDWNWPSVDHLKAPNVAEVAIETRLVNDVKSIMTEEEFRDLISHLAFVMNVIPHENLTWQCGRTFAAPEPPSEPPLPSE